MADRATIARPYARAAFAHAREIDMRLVDAQQARRILDRLVGYQVSPLLWDRVKSRLSAGRVQTVALRLIVEREREITAFVPVEYWSIDADLAQLVTRSQSPRPSFLARLTMPGMRAGGMCVSSTPGMILKSFSLFRCLQTFFSCPITVSMFDSSAWSVMASAR